MLWTGTFKNRLQKQLDMEEGREERQAISTIFLVLNLCMMMGGELIVQLDRLKDVTMDGLKL